MATMFYLYTILVMLICITTGAIALATYFVTRKKMHLFTMSLFLFYFLDLVLIFQYEYLGLNSATSLTAYYDIDNPIIKVLLSFGTLEAMWLIICNYFSEENLAKKLAPGICYIALTLGVYFLLEPGPTCQFLFYETRQVFLIWMLAFCAWRYLKEKDEVTILRMKRMRPLFFIALVLTFSIIIEDVFMILVAAPTVFSLNQALPMYISERNFSENFLTITFAIFTLRACAKALSMRFQEPVMPDSQDKKTHVNDLLPSYCQHHSLTPRERDVLSMILEGKDNQNIASELQLAIGTVKAHTHNILKKTGNATRQDLIRDFWKD